MKTESDRKKEIHTSSVIANLINDKPTGRISTISISKMITANNAVINFRLFIRIAYKKLPLKTGNNSGFIFYSIPYRWKVVLKNPLSDTKPNGRKCK